MDARDFDGGLREVRMAQRSGLYVEYFSTHGQQIWLAAAERHARLDNYPIRYFAGTSVAARGAMAATRAARPGVLGAAGA